MKYEFGNVSTELDNFKLDDNVENNYNDGEHWLLWSKDTYKCYLDEKPVEFKLVVEAADLYGLCGDKSCKGKVEVELYLVPLAKCCTEATLKKANCDEGRPTDEQDLFDYGCTVLMGRESLEGMKGDDPLETETVKHTVHSAVAVMSCFGNLCGFYLDRYQNRIGSTGWDYLEEWCGDGTDYCQAALNRWKAEQNKE